VKQHIAYDLEWSASSTVPMPWEEAQQWCRELREGGHDDWRLPTIRELITLVNYEKLLPACDLPDTAPDGYWSASTLVDSPDIAWVVVFSSGNVGFLDKTTDIYARAVRECKGVQP